MTNASTTSVTDVLQSRLQTSHRKELIEDSSIALDVIAERGYVTVGRPDGSLRDAHGRDTREMLRSLGFPGWATQENYMYPGLHIPMYTPRGQRLPGQWKPRNPVPGPDGKRMRYASAKSPSRLDVHPRWSCDPDPDGRAAALPAIQDVDRTLWITEGVKKADSLTSRGICTIALSGVFNWRNTHATLGDWEDVRLRGREVVICFDADAITKPPVQRAMARLGKWLKHKGAARVWYLVVPPGVNGVSTKGVDDYLAAGGTITQLEQAFQKAPPREVSTSDTYTDSRLAETIAEEVLDGQYIWTGGLGWLRWDGRRWAVTTETSVGEAVRRWALDAFATAAQRLNQNHSDAQVDVDGLRPLLGASRQKAVLGLARGIVERDITLFDVDPTLLNTPGGVVHLPTGDILPHDPDLLMTKITKGSYRPGYTHPDWEQALQALPEDTREWWRARMGVAVSGHTDPDTRILVLQGGGENGKSALTQDGFLHAVGDYGLSASHKLIMGNKNDHSTEIASLMGRRVVVVEELVEEGQINVGALKRIAGTSMMTARKVHRDDMSWIPTHSVIATTNPIPVVKETDHGTWRRLCMIRFPFTFVTPKPGSDGAVPALLPGQLRGDPTLKDRLTNSPTGQHDAMITWAVEGAKVFYANREEIKRKGKAVTDVLAPPDRVERDSLEWRKLSDRILGAWAELLVPDPTASIVTREWWDHFNDWLRANGHAPWALETFSPRFASHAETVRHRVVKKRTREHSSIMRRPLGNVVGAHLKELPKQVEVWVGVRYRLPADDPQTEPEQG